MKAPLPDATFDALAALGDAVALLHQPSDTLAQASPAWQAVLPPVAGNADWAAALPGLRAGLDSAAPRFACCGESDADAAVQVESLPLPGGWRLLRLHDRRSERRDRARELQRQLDDRERLLFTSRSVVVGEMGSTLAHELNQPIGAAANLLRGLRLRLARRDGAAEELQAAERAIEQVMYASRVIARVREFTQSRAPRLVRLDFAALLRASASLLDWDLQRAGVRLALALPARAVWVRGDEVMLQQVLANLLRNAIDALRERSHGAPAVELALREADGEAEASVADNGCGLSPDDEARLFVPFASRKPSGMGIGLSICRSFIELHQGRLWFSRRPDGGSAFHIGLPLAAAGPEERATP